MKSTSSKAIRTGFGLFGAVATLSLIGTASAAADPVIPRPGDGSAADTIDALKSSGFNTQIQFLAGTPNVPLSECKVTSIDNPNGAVASTVTLSTVYVDVSCPNAK